MRLASFLLTTMIIWQHSEAWAVEPMCPGGSNPDPGVIWCDDFEDATPLSQKYFEYDANGGTFVRMPGVGLNGSYGMQVMWQAGEVSAGGFKRSFGRNPVNSQSNSTTDFREIYWRQYLRMQPGWTGSPGKLSRAMILANSNWAEAMIAHLWSDGSTPYLVIDPASGIKNGQLVTTQYNDFANLTWLGAMYGTTPIFDTSNSAKWFCVEAHVRLNTSGQSDGIFEFWIDDHLEAGRYDLNWIDTWQGYGVNAIFFENYWNAGAPLAENRYWDNIVISTKRIGCINSTPPLAPSGLTVK